MNIQQLVEQLILDKLSMIQKIKQLEDKLKQLENFKEAEDTPSKSVENKKSGKKEV
jgi:hypothetical protein